MLVMYLFVRYAHVGLCHFCLPPGVGGWLRLLLVAFLGRFYSPFINHTNHLTSQKLQGANSYTDKKMKRYMYSQCNLCLNRKK